MFVFVFGAGERPDDSPLEDMFLLREHWYGMLGIGVSEYREFMKPRSEKWGTVHLPTKEFRRLAKPFEEWL